MNVRILCCSFALILVCYVKIGNGAALTSQLVESSKVKSWDDEMKQRVARQNADDASGEDSDEDDDEEDAEAHEQQNIQQQQLQQLDESEEDSEEDPENDDEDDEDFIRRRRDLNDANPTNEANAPNDANATNENDSVIPEQSKDKPSASVESDKETQSVVTEISSSTTAPPSRKSSVLVLIRDALKKVTNEIPTEQVATNALQYFQLFEHFIQQTIQQFIVGDDDDQEYFINQYEVQTTPSGETANVAAAVVDGEKQESSSATPPLSPEPEKPSELVEQTPPQPEAINNV